MRNRTLLLFLALSPVAFGQAWPEYEYGGEQFDSFVRDSYRHTKAPKPVSSLYAFLDAGAKTHSGYEWTPWINSKRGELSVSTSKPATREAIAAELHALVKKAVPKFSLERGFEFAHMASGGERQCFSQSVLIASILHRIGIEAGVVMVYRNPKGETSNLGHACTLVKFDNDRAAIIDASHPTPFALHQGLFLRVAGKYQFLKPQFSGASFGVAWPASGGDAQTISRLTPLPLDYIRSMFDYYRGERTTNGILAPKPTRTGLSKSAALLERSVRLCPQNPLAVIQLANCYAKQGRTGQAKLRLKHAERLYSLGGWSPGSVATLRQVLERD